MGKVRSHWAVPGAETQPLPPESLMPQMKSGHHGNTDSPSLGNAKGQSQHTRYADAGMPAGGSKFRSMDADERAASGV